jgi:predicted dehydrogenase
MGLIGCGSMAESHLTSFEPLAARMRFADIDRERAERAAARFSGALAFSDFHDLLPHVDIQ